MRRLLKGRGDRQETFIKNAVSTNRDMPGNRDLLKVVRERTQSLLPSCYHTFSKSLLGPVLIIAREKSSLTAKSLNNSK